MKKKYIRQIIVIVFVILFGVLLYFCNQIEKTELLSNDGRTFEKAVVTQIIEDNITENGNRVGQQTVKLLIESGEHKGEEITATSSSSYLYGADCVEGLKVIAIISESQDTLTASVYNYDRGDILYLIILFFIIVLWLIGGKKGLNSAIGLVFTFICIIFLFLPMIYRGISPILSAVVIVILTTFVVMYLIDGISVKSVCAMMGTMSNTLILAFTGSSINTLVYIYSYNYSYYQVLNMYLIGIEIIQGVSATLGVVLTVPFVAFISAILLSRRQKRLDNKI